MWEVFKAYREESWFPKFEEPKKRERVKDDPNYFKNYYNDHADKIKAYAKEYYQKNKDKLYSNRLTKNQQLVYNYCLQQHRPTWELLPIYHIAQELWMQPFHVWKSIKALINKWKLFQDGNATYIEKPREVLAPALFAEDEPDLYEDIDSPEETIKRLQDENDSLNRKLGNAEERYMKLLWEYTEFKNEVRDAYIKFEDEERNYNHALWVLDKVIMNR